MLYIELLTAKERLFMDNANKIAYLGFIQNVINRMGSNSFLVKGFAITLISALVATSHGKYFFYFYSYNIILDYRHILSLSRKVISQSIQKRN